MMYFYICSPNNKQLLVLCVYFFNGVACKNRRFALKPYIYMTNATNKIQGMEDLF